MRKGKIMDEPREMRWVASYTIYIWSQNTQHKKLSGKMKLEKSRLKKEGLASTGQGNIMRNSSIVEIQIE